MADKPISKNEIEAPSLIYDRYNKQIDYNRNYFLKKKTPCFFGPGQLPNIIGNKYYPPTDWPVKSSLFKMPQIVWLEIAFNWSQNNPVFNYGGDLSGEYDDPNPITDWPRPPDQYEAPDNVGFNSENKGYLFNLFTRVVNHYGGPNMVSWQGYDVLIIAQQNPALLEKFRLLDIFNQVKNTINRKRKGRTWVYVINYFDDDSWGQGTGTHSGIIEQQQYINPFTDPLKDRTWMTCDNYILKAPDPQTIQEFGLLGTNFLNIFCGDIDALIYGGGYHGSDAQGYINSSYWQNPLNLLKNYGNHFFGHQTIYYHPDFSWATLTEVPPHEQVFEDAYGINSLFRDYWHDLSVYSIPPPPADLYHYDNAAITSDNSTGRQTLSSNIYDEVSGDIKDIKNNKIRGINISHPGGTSTIQDSKQIIELIAKKLNFSPNTFEDN